MRLKKFTIILFLFLSAPSFAQKTYVLRDLFKKDTVVWFGVDYSRTAFISFDEGKDMHEYFDGWNRLVTDECDKYNFRKALQKRVLINSADGVGKINREAAPGFRSEPDSALRRRDLQNMIANYQTAHRQGIGLVLVAETYDRRKPVGVHVVVVFDIASRNILITQRYTTIPGGMGTRNFWAPTLLESSKLLNHNYKDWKQKYGG
jgi:hypothetical protein